MSSHSAPRQAPFPDTRPDHGDPYQAAAGLQPDQPRRCGDPGEAPCWPGLVSLTLILAVAGLLVLLSWAQSEPQPASARTPPAIVAPTP